MYIFWEYFGLIFLFCFILYVFVCRRSALAKNDLHDLFDDVATNTSFDESENSDYQLTETYLLYVDICVIPVAEFHSANVHRLLFVSRAVCRDACSKAYADDCSGFLYDPTDRSCTLSPYTGQWLVADATKCDRLSVRTEFYRRIRSSGIVKHAEHVETSLTEFNTNIENISKTT